jgi:hypothetical protein
MSILRSPFAGSCMLCSDLDRAIEPERDGRRGDPEAEVRRWLGKLSEVDEERRGFLRLAANGRMNDNELDEELAQLDETRKVAEQEPEAVRPYSKRVETMELDREAVLEQYAALAPEALDALSPEQRHRLYRMLRLEVLVAKGRDLEIEVAGDPVEGLDADGSSTTEVTSRSARTGARS